MQPFLRSSCCNSKRFLPVYGLFALEDNVARVALEDRDDDLSLLCNCPAKFPVLVKIRLPPLLHSYPTLLFTNSHPQTRTLIHTRTRARKLAQHSCLRARTRKHTHAHTLTVCLLAATAFQHEGQKLCRVVNQASFCSRGGCFLFSARHTHPHQN